MGTTITVDISAECADITLQHEMAYISSALTVSGKFGRLALHVCDEQLAEIVHSINRYLDAKRAYETPDQQQILNAEINQSIEGGLPRAY